MLIDEAEIPASVSRLGSGPFLVGTLETTTWCQAASFVPPEKGLGWSGQLGGSRAVPCRPHLSSLPTASCSPTADPDACSGAG